MNKDCENYGSSWCADFGDNCNECPMTEKTEKPPSKLTDYIYGKLKEIEREEKVKLSDKAFIADHLTPKITELIGQAKTEAAREILKEANTYCSCQTRITATINEGGKLKRNCDECWRFIESKYLEEV